MKSYLRLVAYCATTLNTTGKRTLAGPMGRKTVDDALSLADIFGRSWVKMKTFVAPESSSLVISRYGPLIFRDTTRTTGTSFSPGSVAYIVGSANHGGQTYDP